MSTHNIYLSAIFCWKTILWCDSWGGSFILNFSKNLPVTFQKKVELEPVDLEKTYFS